MREIVGRALVSSHLETVEAHESAIDRIGALGRCSKLGRSLFHLREGLDTSSYPSALKHLIRKASRRLKIYRQHKEFDLLLKMCKFAIQEWLNPLCRTCQGRKEFMDETSNLKITCSVCSGSGMHRYSDNERAFGLQLDPVSYKSVDRNYSEVMLCLRGADAGVIYKCAEQLERWK